MQVDDEPSVKDLVRRMNHQEELIRVLEGRIIALENPHNPMLVHAHSLQPAGSGLFGSSFAPPCKAMHFGTPSSFHPDRTLGPAPIFPPREARDPGHNWGM
jgi:hypothetical protein